MYERQIAIPQLGEEGQKKLEAAAVTVIGAGGLGSPAALYLWYAGVGRLRLVDCDTVSVSNLNRQILYGVEDLDKPKAAAAGEKLMRLHPGQHVETVEEAVCKENIDAVLKGSDVVVDCVDNQETRLVVNEACVRLGIPLIEGGIHGFYGYVMAVNRESACLGCLGYQKEEKKRIPALGAVAGVIGSLQAVEAVKVLTGAGKPLYGQMLTYDGMDGSFETLPVKRWSGCRIHGGRAYGADCEEG